MRKSVTSIIFSFILGFGLNGQSISYEFDTSGVYFINNITGDTLLMGGDNLTSQVSFRIKESNASGYISLRSQLNPIITLHDENDNRNVRILSKFNSNGGAILLSDLASGREDVIRLVTNYANTGDARIITDEIQINGGSDLAELFDITNHKDEISPGLLVVLDPEHPGKLQLSNKPYDKKIAGILSGANGVKPGILMGQEESIATGDNLVTLSGRTYVMVNTSNGSIKIGDMITTSSVKGEGMRATHRKKSKGAVIGKAMTTLENGAGYILVLVNLQ